MTPPKEPTLAEMYLAQFRTEFPYINVWLNGDEMTYRFMSKVVAAGAAEHARVIIATNRLPLEVIEDKMKAQVGAFPFTLKIKYNAHL